MECPVCDDVNLAISSREGVEIDYCPQCRGVWLDRGELDKIIDRASVELAPVGDDRYERERSRRDDDDDRDDDRYRHDDRYRYGDKPRKKKRSFLSDMFEFGD